MLILDLAPALPPQRAVIRWRSAARALVLAGIVGVSGCGTIFRDGVADIPRPSPLYPAIHMDIGMISGAVTRFPRTWGGWGEAIAKTVGGVLDLPISLVTDTLLLPWDFRDFRRSHGSWKGERISAEGYLWHGKTGKVVACFDSFPWFVTVFDAPGNEIPQERVNKGRLNATLQWNEEDRYFVRWSDIQWTPQEVK